MSAPPPGRDADRADLASRAQAVLDFWFSEAARPNWFAKDAGFDRRVTETFLADYERVSAGDLEGWPITPEGLLALVILLDQFPRNMFRGSACAFVGDKAARSAADSALAQGFDDQLPVERRRFLYMPFMHSEDPRDQQRCVDLFARRDDDAEALDFARQHQHIIGRFGRFPHRNSLLGRDNTPEEEAFLREPGSSF